MPVAHGGHIIQGCGGSHHQYPTQVFLLGGCLAKVLQKAGRSARFLGIISPCQASRATGFCRDVEKAAKKRAGLQEKPSCDRV